jgi:murein DD-endopeptidase MepM/ murein hydrolase activator NlpD
MSAARVLLLAGMALTFALLPATGRAQSAPQALDAACAGSPQGRFFDVAGIHADAIDCVGWWGVAQGVEPARYQPSGTVTRGQMASFVARTIAVTGGDLPASPPDAFGDDNGTTHERAINQLSALDVVGGVQPGEYRPAAPVTRAQMASFLANAWRARTGQSLPAGEASFHDIGDDTHRANIERAAAAGLTGGTGAGRYDPAGPVTRAQMGTFLGRFVAKLVAEDHAAAPPVDPVPLPPPRPEFASAAPVTLRHPSGSVELVGYHEANHPGAQQLAPHPAGGPSVTLPSRGRGTGSHSAADVVADPALPVLAPVSGEVIRAGSYPLYCRHPDNFVVIEPDDRPGWEVLVVHFEGLSVAVGDTVTASRTVLGERPRTLPLRSQVDRHTHPRDWPHLHVEVVDAAVPYEPDPC